MGETEVSSGIRQGCTGSPQLFVMVVGRIIERILRSGLGYRSMGVRIPVLFYADDGLMLVRTVVEAERMVEVLERSAGECGLKMNREKSMCMVLNGGGEKCDVIRGVKVVEKIRYLGMQVNEGRKCFKEYKGEKIKMAEKMANVTYSVVGRACDRLPIGKTFWRSVVLPSVLSASSSVRWWYGQRVRETNCRELKMVYGEKSCGPHPVLL